MKDRTLLEDLKTYIAAFQPPIGYGRLQTNLLRRLEAEIANDPHEFRILCSSALFLALKPEVDCQPTKPWEKIFEKMRLAMAKYRKARAEEPDVMIEALLSTLREEIEIEESPRFHPYRIEDKS